MTLHFNEQFHRRVLRLPVQLLLQARIARERGHFFAHLLLVARARGRVLALRGLPRGGGALRELVVVRPERARVRRERRHVLRERGGRVRVVLPVT